MVNRTRVIPARIFARKPTGGRVEVLLLRREDLLTWECLVGGKGLSVGKQLIVESDDSRRRISPRSPKSPDFGLRGEIVEVLEGSRRRLRFAEPIEPYFLEVGHVPLPPYIHEPLKDPERYQTVYAREPGSAAAPTAGLHFTTRLMDELKAQGVNFAEVTLHVGLDTFAPVTEEDPEEHQIHTEWCEVPPATVDAITRARQSGGRIIAVGTTSVRTLESAARVGKDSHPVLQRADEFIYSARLPVQTGRCHDHQFPPAQIHPDHAGQRLCRTRTDPACICSCHAGALSLLFVRGRYAYILIHEEHE